MHSSPPCSGCRRVCFVVNPFAGIGGPLALKGSDGRAMVEALRKGARLIAPERAVRFLRAVRRLLDVSLLEFYTAGGLMGADELSSVGIGYRVVHNPSSWPTSAEDTVKTVRGCLSTGTDVVVFVGGDGTARDVVRGLGGVRIPVIGVPSGVKVYSSVFGVSPEASAKVLADCVKGSGLCDAEIMDIDEEAFRRGELRARLYAIVATPCSPALVGASKQPSRWGYDEVENARAIADYIVENMENCTLYILGPGTTIKYIAEKLGIPKTILGVDVVHNGRLIASDVDEETLFRIVSSHVKRGGRVKIVLTPIGGQGFILGRGNQQISPRIIRLAGGRESLVIVATRAKLSRLETLRVDTGDPQLDLELSGYIRVVVDYGEEEVRRVEAYY